MRLRDRADAIAGDHGFCHAASLRMRASYVRMACLLFGVVAIALAARHVDWPAARASLHAMGVRAPLIVLPYFFVVSFDTLGWHAVFEHPRHTQIGLLWRVRVTTDAVINTLPGGAALGEALKIILLKRGFQLGLSEAVANVAICKVGIAIAQAAFLVCGIAIASADLNAHSVDLIGQPGLQHWSLWGALSLLLLVVSLGAAVQTGLLVRIVARLGRAGSPPWRARMQRLEAPLARIDHGLGVARRIPGWRVVIALSAFFASYLSLAFEDWLILHLLGIDVSFARALSMAAIISVLRVCFFFIPSGLGAQELGYYGLLKLYGVPHVEEAAAAFAIVKRCKDVIWIGLGYGLLAGLPARVTDVRPRPAQS